MSNLRKPKVNISIGGKWHFYDIVAAAANAGYLNHFYTTVYFKNTKLIQSKIGRRFNFQNRSNSLIPADKVVSNFFPELIPKIEQFTGIMSDGESLLKKCVLFDNWTQKIIDDCDIFHSQDGFCLKTASKLKARGSKIVCDRGIVSISYLKKISEEYRKLGILKEYADIHIESRTRQEHSIADKILIPTETVKLSLIEEGIPADKLKIIPYGVDLEFFKKNDIKRGTIFKVLFVGEISIRKGCHFLLQAWKEMNLRQAELTLVGKIEKGFENYLASYEGSFTHINYTSQLDLINFYSISNVLVLPSLAEGSARVIYEALACELPVVYSTMSGSIARNHLDGFEIEPYSKDAITEKLLYFYNNIEIGVEMGINGSNWIKNFSKETYSENIIKMYNEL